MNGQIYRKDYEPYAEGDEIGTIQSRTQPNLSGTTYKGEV